jgi:hypothetical protein
MSGGSKACQQEVMHLASMPSSITQDLLLLLLAAGFSIIASPVEEKKEKTKSEGQTKSEGGSAAGETEAVIVFKDGSSMPRLAAACDRLRRALGRVCVCFGAAGQQQVQ